MPGRFTIQFNMDDPQQRTAADFLERHGRRKAQVLTSAILHYIQETPQGHSGTPVEVSEAALEQMMLSIVRKHPQLVAGQGDAPVTAKAAPQPEVWPNTGGDDALRAITNTLEAFQKR